MPFIYTKFICLFLGIEEHIWHVRTSSMSLKLSRTRTTIYHNILIYACIHNIPAHLQSIDIPLFWWVEAEVPNKKFLTSYFALCKPLWIPTNPAHHKDILTILINKYDDKRETNPMFHCTLLSRNPWQENLLCALLSKDWIKTWHVQYMD